VILREPSSVNGLLALALCSAAYIGGRLLFRRMQGAFADVI
jgi:hypothetical protein